MYISHTLWNPAHIQNRNMQAGIYINKSYLTNYFCILSVILN